MPDTVISVENLSKQYFLGKGANSEGLRHAIHDLASAPLRWLKSRGNTPATIPGRNGTAHPKKNSPRDFWALKDVSFEIKRGEVVGIIGRNGAGKSTLLKILSRITEPTQGHIEITGRVASLLEVGTGFHPELTGRENVFLNGAILGMSRSEIKRKFDEIVAFAEVEQFLDTPVKRYSSGMYVRLAFAVAAHLEPEILIVDEVLAVGDAQFQKKCLGKMQDVSKGGRTVLFVSHNMAAISSLCSSAIAMQKGSVSCLGSVSSCMDVYLNNSDASSLTWKRPISQTNNSPVIFSKIVLQTLGEQPVMTLRVNLELEKKQNHQPAFIAIDICDDIGTSIMQAIPTLDCFVKYESKANDYEVNIHLPPLVPGHYSLSLWIGPHNNETYDLVSSVVGFDIEDTPTKGRSFPHTRDHGCIVPLSSLSNGCRL